MSRFNIAVLMTVFNRRDKTLKCFSSLQETMSRISGINDVYAVKVFLTDDGCTDGTADAVRTSGYSFPVIILPGTGALYWNGGMINSWKAAIADPVKFDGYLLLNDDTVVLDAFWRDLERVDAYCLRKYGKRGIYCGSTRDAATGQFTYGGFDYVNKFTLLDRFVIPDGKTIKECEACHGNITYVSSEVVEHEGILCEDYIHGGSDHDYSYLAHKHGFPVLVMPDFCGECENDHIGRNAPVPSWELSLKERIVASRKPTARNFHNVLLFNKRCFPWRLPFVWLSGVIKILFPRFARIVYLSVRK